MISYLRDILGNYAVGGYDYILPRVSNFTFKSTCVNRCLFSNICLSVILDLILFIYFISIVNKAQLMHYWYLINTIIIIIVMCLLRSL